MQGSLMLDIGGTWLTAEDRQLLRQPEVAGLILFARNIESPRQVRELSMAIRAVRPDLLLAVDQEGGLVQRLKGSGFDTIPSAKVQSKWSNAKLTSRATRWGRQLASAGVHWTLAPVTDTFLFDIKQIDSDHHKALFGIGNEGVRRNLEWLVDSGANVIVRMPLVRGYNDSWEAITGAIDYVQKLAKRGNIRRIDMLPYHQLGRKKYDRLEMPYPILNDPTYSVEELNKLEAFFAQFDFDIRLVRH